MGTTKAPDPREAGGSVPRAAPRVPGYPWLGNTLAILRNPLENMTAWGRLDGHLVEARVLGQRVYQLNHPDLIGEVLRSRDGAFEKDQFTRALSLVLGQGLLTSEGALWKRQRSLMHSAFTPKRVRSYADLMVTAAERSTGTLTTGRVHDLHEAMSGLTLDIVSRALFHANVREDTRAVAEALMIVSGFYAHVIRFGLWPLQRLPTPGNLRFRRAVSTIDRILYGVIEARRREPGRPEDLLSHLLEAADEEGGTMTDTQLRDECVTLFLAGHETTALALTFTWYLLAQNPEVEARLHAELEDVLGGRRPHYDDLERLPYTARVIKESMRLYPPAYAIGREAMRDTTLGGYRIDKGSQVIVSQWVTHRDPRWFPNPLRFDPDRWKTDDRPHYAYFPFGGGPRICIGNHFAMMEATLLLATLAQRVRFVLDAPDRKLGLLPSVTLRPKGGLPVRVEPRAPGSQEDGRGGSVLRACATSP